MSEYNASWLEYCQAIESILRFYMIHGKPPEYICVPYTNPTTCTNKFYQRDWEDAMKRVQSYMDSHNGTNPPMVWFRNLTPPTPSKSAFHLKVESALGKTFNTADELANILRNHPDYQYYYNDMKTPDQTLAALKVVGGAGANCVDISQVIMRVLRDMKYSNVNIWRGTFKCGGHVWVTYGSDNKIFDAAGMMKYGYPIGRYMCSGSPWDLNKNPAWLLSDDAKT